MKYYILHGTLVKNLIKILESGNINIIHKGSKGMLNKSSNQIFTQLLYRNIPNQEDQVSFWFQCCIVLDKKILKDFPFYATNIGGFKNNFNSAFINNTEKKTENRNCVIIKGNGNLEKMPNLSKLKKNINEYMEEKKKYIHDVQYIHSHEILFKNNIPLNKYCLCIIVNFDILDNEQIKKIKKLSDDNNIPIKNYEFVDTGLNNFIDLIENKI